MMEILLTKGKVALVDDEDYERISRRKWFAYLNKKVWYAGRKAKGGHGSRPTIQMHREILNLGPGQMTDHKDGDGLNNTRTNLRLCTIDQNNQHRTTPPGPSGFRGVQQFSTHGWRAEISYCDKRIRMSPFRSPVEAARAYDQKARELHGDFAVLNFP